MNIDLHCHFFPERYLDLVRREGTVGDVTLERGPSGDGLRVDGGQRVIPMTDRFRSPQALLAAMDAARIDLAAVSAAPPMFHYELEPRAGREVARAINVGLAELVRAQPDRLALFAAVPLQDPAAAIEELEFAARELGARGVEIGTNVQGRNLDSRDLFPFFERVQALDLVLFVHPARVAGADRMRRYYLANLIGNPVDTSVAIASLVFGGVLERLPRLKAVFCHGGGTVPYIHGRWRHGYGVRPEPRDAVPHPPEHYLRRLYFDTITHDARALRYLIDVMTSERVVLGSDHPFDMGDPRPVDSLEAVEGLTVAERRRILGENAASLLGLTAGARSA